MKTKKLSYSTLRTIFENVKDAAYEYDSTPKEFAKALLNNKDEMKYYINDLKFDMNLMKNDKDQTLYQIYEKSVKELSLYLEK